MGLNAKDIQLCLFKVIHDSTKCSYMFIQRHPIISSALLVCFILYISLSYIYNFLVYMFPFFVCGIIFIKIFWSSEKTQLKYVKIKDEKEEQKKVEQKCPKIPNYKRPGILYKYPSQNATSRRRNFSDKNWDVYGGLEENAKDLSTAFHNEFIKRNMENKWGKYFEKGESSLENRLFAKKTQVPKRQPLRTEPSMVDLVECGDLEIERKIEDGDDEEETQEDRNKAIEWTEDDQKNLTYLGISEMERNKRLESLIARRKEKKLFKGQPEKVLNDKKPIAPLFIKRNNPLNSLKEFDDGLEMPGSAPSLMPRSPYDIPYVPSEEKPNLTRDNFSQEFSSQNDMQLCRHESFSLGHPFPSETKHDHGAIEHYFLNRGRKYSDRFPYSRFRRNHTDKGTHDWLIDQLFYNESEESGLQTSNPSTKGEDSTNEEDEKRKIGMNDMKGEKVECKTKSVSDQISESRLEKSGRWPKFPKPHERVFNLPISTNSTSATTSNINEVMYESVTSVVDKRQENMFLTSGRLCHTPTYSVASDLQVEVSEIGSPTSTVGENAEVNSSIDRDSMTYDGDIDRDISSGSEELWGASFHGGKETPRVKNDGDNVEVKNSSKGVVSPFDPCHIDEENAIDVCSPSSKIDVPENTPTHAIDNHHNIFGYTKHPMGETEAPQSSNSSHALDQFPNETHPENPNEWCNVNENVRNEAQFINDVDNTSITNQYNIENSRNNEDPDTSVMRQESIDDVSIYSVSSSPRSVLPEKIVADEISLSNFDQNMHIDDQQSIVEGLTQESLDSENSPNIMPRTRQPTIDDVIDEISLSISDQHMHIEPQRSIMDGVTQESSNNESPHDVMPQTMQPMMDDLIDEISLSNFDQHIHTEPQQSTTEGVTSKTLASETSSDIIPQITQPIIDDTNDKLHNVNFDQSQEHICTLENLKEESNIFENMNDEVCNKEKHIKLKNNVNNEHNSNDQNSQEAITKSTSPISEIANLENMNEKPRDLMDNKIEEVLSTKMLNDVKNDKPSSSNNVHEELSKQKIIKPRTQSRESGYLSDVFD